VEQERILAQLDKMVASGRMTDEEAAAVRAAATSEEFERAMGAVRARHASVHMVRAVAAGSMSQAEADADLERLRNGEHPDGLRVRLAGFEREPGDLEGPHT
jgi:hypothetical protein